MADEKIPDFKAIIAVIWVGILTAIIVTIIDWKIKQDILRLTDTFYRVYQDGIPNVESAASEGGRPSDSDRIHTLHSVDNDARVEEGILREKVPSPFENTNPRIFRGFPPELERELQPSGTEDFGRLPEGFVELSGDES